MRWGIKKKSTSEPGLDLIETMMIENKNQSAILNHIKTLGVDSDLASHYLSEIKAWGHLCFANPQYEKEVHRSQLVKNSREALLKSISSKSSALETREQILKTLVSTDNGSYGTKKENPSLKVSTEDKKAFLIRHRATWSQVVASSDVTDGLTYWVGSDIYDRQKVPVSWDQVSPLFEQLTVPVPGELPQDSNLKQRMLEDSALNPSQIEEKLHDRVQQMLKRFNLGSIRISGLPDEKRAIDSLNALEKSFETIAKKTNLPDAMIGLGGFTVHLACDMGSSGSAYMSASDKLLALSPSNGWRATAHEWFHGFDATLGSLVDPAGDLLSDVEFSKIEKAKSILLASKQWDLLNQSKSAMDQVLKGLKTGPGIDVLEKIKQEENQVAIQRMREGIGERFYFNRLKEASKQEAIEAFNSLSENLLNQKASLSDIKQWRVSYLEDDLVEKSKHYDAFVMAEVNARNKRVKEVISTDQSLMFAFAKEADEHLVQVTGEKGWHGYSASNCEMLARGYEGNFFNGITEDEAAVLTDARDNSMYWPVGAERGANRDAYDALFDSAFYVFKREGYLPEDAVRPATGLPVSSESSNPSKEASTDSHFIASDNAIFISEQETPLIKGLAQMAVKSLLEKQRQQKESLNAKDSESSVKPSRTGFH